MVKRRLGTRVVVVILAVILTAALNPGLALGYQNYPTNYGRAIEVVSSYCINASSVTWADWAHRTTVPTAKATQTTLENNVETLINSTRSDRLASSYDPSGTNLYAAFGGGHDPRGWATAVYQNTPAGYYAQDYRYTSQNTADLELVWNLYLDQGDPQGVIVGAHTLSNGEGVSHAILAYDLVTTTAPGMGGFAMEGFYVLDPWYGSGLGSIGLPSPYPSGGYSSSTLIGMSDWNSIFRPMVAHGFDFKYNGSTITLNSTYYQGYYNLVLRAQPSYGAPADNAVNAATTYGDYLQVHGGSMPASSPTASSTGAYQLTPVSPTLAGAASSGLQQLVTDQGNTSLAGVGLGTSVHVDSLDQSSPSYELVDLERSGQALAVAKVNDVAGGYQLGSIQWVTDAYKPFTAANQSAYANAAGLSGPTRLVWTMSDASWSPFQPMIDVATAGGHRYLGPGGVSTDVGQ